MSIHAGINMIMISQIHTKQPQLLPHAASKTIPTKSRDCLHRTCSNFQKQLDRQQQNGKEQTGLRDVFFKAEQLDMASVKSKCNISGYILCFSTIHFYSTWSVKVKTKPCHIQSGAMHRGQRHGTETLWGVPGALPELVLSPPHERTSHLLPRRTNWPHLHVSSVRRADRCGHALRGLINYTQSFLSALLMKVGGVVYRWCHWFVVHWGILHHVNEDMHQG